MFINRHLLGFARGNEKRIICVCFLQLILTALGTLVSLCAAFAVRMIQGEHRIFIYSELWQVFVTIATLITLKFVLARIKSVASEKCSLRIKTNVREKMLRKLFALGPAYLSKERTGNIASVITGKVEYLNEYYTIYLPSAVSALINALVIICIIMRINFITSAICIIGCAGMTVCPMIFYFLMRERGEKEMQAHSQYYSDCLDSIQGMTTLKAFNADARRRKLIHEKGEQLRKAVMSQMRITMLENVVLQFFAGLGSAFSVAVAAWECTRGNIRPETLVYVLFLIGACFSPMYNLINAWHMGYRGVVASYSISELLEETVRMSLIPVSMIKNTHKKDLKEGISFNNVSFAYNEDDGDVLSNISFRIPKGTTAALVGSSGSGKSTIVHLLAGFYPVERGSVEIDGIRLDEDSVSDIQDMISAVWQDSRLFYGTVEENILIGRPGASHEHIVKAAEKASIHDFILSLPEGYGTMMGEQGKRFSGGERQRIALARAFLRDAPIVILDEATSSLDRRNEKEIQKSLHDLRKGKTCLIIAHRLSTIQSADLIIIMEKGKAVEQGTHNELLKRSDKYKKLMGEQQKGGAALDV